jgi:shikimate kinase
MSPVAIMVGMMGAGKTTVGELVAEKLNAAFRDVDHDIEVTAGKPIPEIFVDEGEERFRALETAALTKAINEFEGVLAVGGGAVLAEENRALLRGQPVVWLTVQLGDALTRVGMGQGRPLLSLNPRATLRHLMEQRRPLYEEVAAITVATDGRTPEDIATEVVSCLKQQ